MDGSHLKMQEDPRNQESPKKNQKSSEETLFPGIEELDHRYGPQNRRTSLAEKNIAGRAPLPPRGVRDREVDRPRDELL